LPGYIDTEINHQHRKTEQGQKLVQMLPRNAWGSRAWTAGHAVFERNHFINGADR
jgi:hypothetical protein